jgi:hypothetical protein
MRDTQEPATAPWGPNISDANFNKLKAGFEPQDQNDKLSITTTEQPEDSIISIHIVRAGLCREFYRLILNPGDEGKSAMINAIT